MAVGGVGRVLRCLLFRRVLGGSRTASRCALGFLLQCIADFLVADACVLCGRQRYFPRGSVAGDDDVSPGPVIADCLTRPVDQPCLGPLAIRNHPICGPCAARLPAARWRGELGRVVDGGVTVAASGEQFDCRSEDGGFKLFYDNMLSDSMTIEVIAPLMECDATLRLIHLLKFSRYEALAVPMGLAMAEALVRLGAHPGPDTLVVPVPMAPRDRRHRGFNQAERLARVVGAAHGIAVADILAKTPQTRRQSQTARSARAENVRSAFCCRETIGSRPVILVDDLVTTGATAASCAAELLRSGAGSIRALCFARAL